jgi:hypothetical protein
MTTETIDVLEFIARFVQHIPDKGMQMVRYYGVYSNVVSDKVRKSGKGEVIEVVEDRYGMRSDYRKSWRKNIFWIYEVDPLRCPECGGNMHIVEIVCQEEDIKDALKSMPGHKRWFYNPSWHGG